MDHPRSLRAVGVVALIPLATFVFAAQRAGAVETLREVQLGSGRPQIFAENEVPTLKVIWNNPEKGVYA